MEQDQHKLIGKFTSRYRLNSSEIKDESQPSTEDDESMDELGINRSRYLDDGSGSLEEDINNEDDDDDDDDDEDTDGDGSSEDSTWVEWYCSLPGNEWLTEVSEDFIDDHFNLTGLNNMVSFYSEALDLIQDSGPSGNLSETQVRIIQASAERLFLLIHQRFINTKLGLSIMKSRFKEGIFGYCPRVICENQPVIPVGLSDLPGKGSVKLFCPNCLDIYRPPFSKHHNIDGCAFGTTSAHLMFLSFPSVLTGMAREKFLHSIPQDESSDSVASDPLESSNEASSERKPLPHCDNFGIYCPRLYGFKIHESSVSGRKMSWLRRFKPLLNESLKES